MTNDLDYAILKPYGCTYLGNAQHPCGSKDLVEGKLYCVDHYAVMYQKGSALRKRKKDTRRADALRQLVSDFNAAVEELESEGFDCYASEVVEEMT